MQNEGTTVKSKFNTLLQDFFEGSVTPGLTYVLYPLSYLRITGGLCIREGVNFQKNHNYHRGILPKLTILFTY